ncbi:MAG: hypothetical protein AB1750_04010 [Chloroflexota bacterium]
MKTSKVMRKWGWLSFQLMWLPFITIFIGMMSLPEGEYEWAELPMLARVSMIAAGSLAALSTVLLVGSSVVSAMANRALQEQGQPAQATVLKIWDTGTTINQNPVVRMLLEVRPPGGTSFQAETERLVSRLQIPQIQPGAIVAVKYDPQSQAVALMETEEANA